VAGAPPHRGAVVGCGFPLLFFSDLDGFLHGYKYHCELFLLPSISLVHCDGSANEQWLVLGLGVW
jgi:hypothetical protein